MNIRDVLFGLKVGKIQSVGHMQVIPLIAEPELDDLRFVTPAQGGVKFGTDNYGSMRFQNPSEDTVIVPAHAAYMTKAAAQDHCMVRAGFVGKGKSAVFNDACCIQQTQCGTFQLSDSHEMCIIPFALRRHAITMVGQQQFQKLWSSIINFKRSYGIDDSGTGNLVDFENAFSSELDNFIAEFECVPRQVGAIILMDGEVIGVERAPSEKYWLGIWESLIRLCYGSYAIWYSNNNAKVKPSTRVTFDADGCANLSDLIQKLEKVQNVEQEMASDAVRQLIDEPFTDKKNEALILDNESIFMYTMRNPQLSGQVMCSASNNRVYYASFTVNERWKNNSSYFKQEAFNI